MFSLILVWLALISSAFAQPVTFTSELTWLNGSTILQSEDGLARMELIPATSPQTVAVSDTAFSYATFGQIRVTNSPGSYARGQLFIRVNTGAGFQYQPWIYAYLYSSGADSSVPLRAVGMDGVYFSLAEHATFPHTSGTQTYELRARLTRASVRVLGQPSGTCSNVTAGENWVTVDVSTLDGLPVLSRFFDDGTGVSPAAPGKATVYYSDVGCPDISSTYNYRFSVEAAGMGPGLGTIALTRRPFNFAVSPKEFSFSYTRGQSNPPVQRLILSGGASMGFDWTALGYDGGWVSVTPSAGSMWAGGPATAELTLSPNMSTKAAGYHSSRIRIESRKSSEVTGEVKLNFYVADEPGSLTTTSSPTNAGTIALPNTPLVNGNKITLEARPNPGYSFVRWSGTLTSTANPLEFVLNGRTNLTAEFAYTGAGCGITLSPTLLQAPAAGDIGRIDVTTANNCTWDVTQLPSWLTVRKSANYLNYRIDPNPSALTRQATLLIGNAPLDVRQVGESCSSLRLQRPDAFDATTSTRNVTVTADPACSYIAGRSETWLSAATSAITGNQTLPITAQPNGTGAPRLSTYFIGGQRLAILQKPVTPVLPYTDVTAAHSLGEYITLLQRNNIADTCGANLFCPEHAITRSEAARQIVLAVLGTTDFTPDPATFIDVPTTHPNFKWIQKLAELGITNGCTATTFCPDAPVTRGQMAAFLVRARGGITATEAFPFRTAPVFTDVAATNTFFSHVQKLFDWGITNGCTAATFCVDQTTTRSQMATFLSRAFLSR